MLAPEGPKLASRGGVATLEHQGEGGELSAYRSRGDNHARATIARDDAGTVTAIGAHGRLQWGREREWIRPGGASGNDGVADDTTEAGAGDDDATDKKRACILEDNPEAWGAGGNAGWAREWLYAQCAVAVEGSVITFINQPGTCSLQPTEGHCTDIQLLGACGLTGVSLTSCSHCQTLCADSAATCKPTGSDGRRYCSSDPEKPCDNPEQCKYTVAPSSGEPCSTGSIRIASWADFYDYKSGSTPEKPVHAAAPKTYCAWSTR